MRRPVCMVLLGTGLLLGPLPAARSQIDFAVDPLNASPGLGTGGFGYSGFGYGAYGPRGYGYYTGLYLPPYGGGPSLYYSPIFNAMAAAPRDSVHYGPASHPPGTSAPAPDWIRDPSRRPPSTVRRFLDRLSGRP